MIEMYPRPDIADMIEAPESIREILDLSEAMFPFHDLDTDETERVIHIVGAWLRGARA